MFFFFPFYPESKAFSNGGGSSQAKTLPLLPASESARRSSSAPDFGNFAVDFIRQAISALMSSLTALGNAANALFAQTTAAFAANRVANDAAGFLNGNWFGFGAQKAGPSFGSYRQGQDPMSFSPFLTQGFNPLAFNPWTAFAEGMNFWASLWMPAAGQRNPFSFGGKSSASPFMTKVSTPNGLSWGFAWGA